MIGVNSMLAKSLQCPIGLGNQQVGLRKTTDFGRNRKVLTNEE